MAIINIHYSDEDIAVGKKFYTIILTRDSIEKMFTLLHEPMGWDDGWYPRAEFKEWISTELPEECKVVNPMRLTKDGYTILIFNITAPDLMKLRLVWF